MTRCVLLFQICLFLCVSSLSVSGNLSFNRDAKTVTLGSGSGSVSSSVGNGDQKLQSAKLVQVTASASAKSNDADGDSDVLSSQFNLAKTILGAGILSLPSGIAAFSDSRMSLIPATGVLIFMSLMSAYTFSSIGSACEQHNVRGFADAWGSSVDKKSAVAISTAVTVKTFFACLAYGIIIGDTFSSLAKSANFPSLLQDRANVIIGITAAIIFPLNLLKNLDALKYTSILGLGGIFYCCLFVTKRYFDGSYAPGGQFFNDIEIKPSFDSILPGSKPWYSLFIFISMMSTAFSAHYNAPRFWNSLKNRSMKRYNNVISGSFLVSVIAYATIMIFGFLTFGGNSLGFVLNNYSKSDSMANIARVAIGLGILFGYPLTFSALRDGVMDLVNIPSSNIEGRNKANIPLTIALMSLLTIGGIMLKNLGIVVAFSGSLIGANVIYTVPAIMNICNMKSLNKGNAQNINAQQLINVIIGALGIIIASIGVTVTVITNGGGH